MRWNFIVVGVVAVGAAVHLAGNAVGQNSGEGAQQPSADEMKAMMEGMQKYMEGIKPGKHHEPLNHFVGSWETTTKMWWGGPGSDPIVTKGVSEAKWVLGGRFVMSLGLPGLLTRFWIGTALLIPAVAVLPPLLFNLVPESMPWIAKFNA